MSSSKSNSPRFVFKAAGEEIRVVSLEATEEISSPFEAKLKLASEKSLEINKLVGAEASLTIAARGGERRFGGVLLSFGADGVRGRFHMYRAVLVPRLKLLDLRRNSRIFQNKTAPEIVSTILKEANIDSDRFRFALSEERRPREFRVQYRETDLEFMNRILSEEGIFYRFGQGEDEPEIVFGDSPSARRHIEGKKEIVFNEGDAESDDEDSIDVFSFGKRLAAGKATLRDFNPEKPSLDLTVSKEDRESGGFEIYDYPGGYSTVEDGRKLAATELARAVMGGESYSGEGNCARFASGFGFSLSGRALGKTDGKYLLTEIRHAGERPLGADGSLSGSLSGSGTEYRNFFFCLDESAPYAPPKRRKPATGGVQTAIVAGPEGEEVYTDDQGRIKVRFHWDREGRGDEKSSCWIRAAQNWSGSGWGSAFIPRVGREVIVDFIDGDPDRPIVTGCVYNAADSHPWPLPDRKTAAGVRTPGSAGVEGSEISLDDKKGEEELRLRAQRDRNDVTENNHSIHVKADRSLKVGGSRDTVVEKGDDSLSVLKGDRSVDVKGAYRLKAAGEELSLALESAGRIGLRNASGSLKETLDEMLDHQRTALRLLNEFLVEYAAHAHASAAPGAPTSPPATAPKAGKIIAEATAESTGLEATGGRISSLLK